MATDDIHGTSRGVHAHTRDGEHLCLSCAAFEVDKGRAWRIRTGRAKEIRLSVHDRSRSIEHGTRSAVNSHARKGEPCCLPCADFAADRSRAARIAYRRRKHIHISVETLSRLLSSSTAVEILAAEIGPQTLAALRNLRPGEQRA